MSWPIREKETRDPRCYALKSRHADGSFLCAFNPHPLWVQAKMQDARTQHTQPGGCPLFVPTPPIATLSPWLLSLHLASGSTQGTHYIHCSSRYGACIENTRFGISSHQGKVMARFYLLMLEPEQRKASVRNSNAQCWRPQKVSLHNLFMQHRPKCASTEFKSAFRLTQKHVSG